jgi:2-methylcitrate dehydratase PrpD
MSRPPPDASTPAAAAPAAVEPATERLAAYVATLRYEDIPPAVVWRAKHCLIDAIGCAVFGQQFPWSAMILAEAAASGGGGPCRLPGIKGATLHVPQAALVLGALAHAFEFDNLRKPGTGVHAGATVALPALVMAQSVNASGTDLIAAMVAGIEVMFRVGLATLHSAEKVGFHAPGLTGPFGAAAACASLMRLSARETANAFGIAGSMAGGLLAFAKAGSGGMVKRLHLGRAAEAGVVAARLAQRGYEGPRNVLEGRYGVLDAFCEATNPALLTKGLGETYETSTICFKRYPCHVTAHVPVQLLRGFMERHGFGGDDIRELAVGASDKVRSHHSERDPADIMLAQYSVPFCVAIAAYHDPLDPAVFCDRVAGETRVRELAKRISMSADENFGSWGARMRVVLHDGRTFEEASATWPGCPDSPLSDDALREKFERLTSALPAQHTASLFTELMRLEQLSSIDRIVQAAGPGN